MTHRAMPVLTPSMAVVMQEMVEVEYAGVCFSSGPTAKTANVTIVEAVSGCGEQLVSGQVTPSHYEIDESFKICSSRISSSIKKPPTAKLIKTVAEMAKRIAKHFGCPQDIEWASVGDYVYLLIDSA